MNHFPFFDIAHAVHVYHIICEMFASKAVINSARLSSSSESESTTSRQSTDISEDEFEIFSEVTLKDYSKPVLLNTSSDSSKSDEG